mgnify:CR=1 FL=1
MARLLRMPAIAANATEALLGQWMLAEGAEFRAGDALAVVETEKAAVDVSADRPGRLVRALAESGATVEVGDPIALIADPGEEVADVAATLAELGATGGTAPATPAAPTPTPTPTAASPATVESIPERTRIFVSPLARRLAGQAGLALASLVGTGQNGRIVRRDVELALTQRSDERPAAVGTTPVGEFEDIPHTRMRQAIAQRLVASMTQAPHFYVKATCRADALLAARTTINAALADTGVKVSVNDFIVKAMGWALQRVPEMNVVWLEHATRRFTSADIAVAIALPTGLITPVVRNVERLSLADLARTIQDLADRARSGRLQPSDLDGGSMTVSNLGMHGVEEFSAIINPPHASILAVGAVQREVVVDGDDLAIASVLRVTLSVDHRPLDGVIAARWLAAFTQAIENPVLLLA